jgi:histidine triad (HIT) family protein
MADYDPTNVFARILRGELPCHMVEETEDILVFMDIMPRVDGHALVIPKAPCRNIFDAPPSALAAVIAGTQRLARAAKIAFTADGVQIAQYNEAPAGQVVFHLHMHVLPIREGVPLRPPGIMGDPALLAQHAERLKGALGKV